MGGVGGRKQYRRLESFVPGSLIAGPPIRHLTGLRLWNQAAKYAISVSWPFARSLCNFLVRPWRRCSGLFDMCLCVLSVWCLFERKKESCSRGERREFGLKMIMRGFPSALSSLCWLVKLRQFYIVRFPRANNRPSIKTSVRAFVPGLEFLWSSTLVLGGLPGTCEQINKIVLNGTPDIVQTGEFHENKSRSHFTKTYTGKINTYKCITFFFFVSMQ